MRYLVNIDNYSKSHHTENETTLITEGTNNDENDDLPKFIPKPNQKEKLVSIILCSLGALKILTNAIINFPSKRNIVENAFYVMCTLLVDNENRKGSICPYKLCAETTIKILSRNEYNQDATILGLGAIVLRNLACVTQDEIISPPSIIPMVGDNGSAAIGAAGPSLITTFTQSPALVVTQVGAAAILEDIMSRFPDDTTIQENGRCALYNLLLLGANRTRK